MSSQVMPVASREQLDSTVYWLQGQGWVLTWYAPPTATLTRGRSISCGAVLFLFLFGWIFFWLPLFIYLIWYAVDHGDLVTVQVQKGSPDGSTTAGGAIWVPSADGRWWWDGHGWQAATPIPPYDVPSTKSDVDHQSAPLAFSGSGVRGPRGNCAGSVLPVGDQTTELEEGE